jgi:hypothetical protein
MKRRSAKKSAKKSGKRRSAKKSAKKRSGKRRSVKKYGGLPLGKIMSFGKKAMPMMKKVSKNPEVRKFAKSTAKEYAYGQM